MIVPHEQGQSSDQKKQTVLADLEEMWNRADKKGEHFELKYQQGVKTLTAVSFSLLRIFFTRQSVLLRDVLVR